MARRTPVHLSLAELARVRCPRNAGDRKEHHGRRVAGLSAQMQIQLRIAQEFAELAAGEYDTTRLRFEVILNQRSEAMLLWAVQNVRAAGIERGMVGSRRICHGAERGRRTHCKCARHAGSLHGGVRIEYSCQAHSRFGCGYGAAYFLKPRICASPRAGSVLWVRLIHNFRRLDSRQRTNQTLNNEDRIRDEWTEPSAFDATCASWRGLVAG